MNPLTAPLALVATFNTSVAALVNTFSKGDFVPTDCAAGVGGSLIAAGSGYTIVPYEPFGLAWRDGDGKLINAGWQKLVWGFPNGYSATPQEEVVARQQIASTGYSVEQFAELQQVFLDAGSRYNPDCPRQPLDRATANLNGLLAVVDKLADIHGTDPLTAQAAKALFMDGQRTN